MIDQPGINRMIRWWCPIIVVNELIIECSCHSSKTSIGTFYNSVSLMVLDWGLFFNDRHAVLFTEDVANGFLQIEDSRLIVGLENDFAVTYLLNTVSNLLGRVWASCCAFAWDHV